MSCMFDQFDLGSGNPLGEFLRIGGIDNAISLAPNDQTRRRDAMNPVL